MSNRLLLAGSALAALAAVLGCKGEAPTASSVFDVRLEIVGTCPVGFNLVTAGRPALDRNGDGYYCKKYLRDELVECVGRPQPCTAIIDNSKPIKGECPTGFEKVDASEQVAADWNEDQIVCRAAGGGSEYTDNSY